MKERILLLTKNYPPQIGGIEKYSFDLHNRLVKEWNTVYLIAAAPRNVWLLTRKWAGKGIASKFWKLFYLLSELWRLNIFAIKCFTLWFFYSFRSDLIWSLDGSIGWIALALGKLMRKKTRVTIHGTDIVWDNFLYQRIIPTLIGKCHEVYAVSVRMKQEAIRRGIPKVKILIQEHSLKTHTLTAVSVDFDRINFLTANLIPIDKVLLFSIGRFIEIKWFHWFIEEILPHLDLRYHYILWWFWPLESYYKKIVLKKWLKNITFLGAIVDDSEKAAWFAVSDYYIMPNIWPEWFGLVLLEAQFYWLPIIASKTDGVQYRTGKNSQVLESSNSQLWIKTINSLHDEYFSY